MNKYITAAIPAVVILLLAILFAISRSHGDFGYVNKFKVGDCITDAPEDVSDYWEREKIYKFEKILELWKESYKTEYWCTITKYKMDSYIKYDWERFYVKMECPEYAR